MRTEIIGGTVILAAMLLGLVMLRRSARGERAGASGQGAPDPLKEAEVFISFGRKAQALAILQKALQENPSRADIQEKLQQLRG